MGVLGITIGSAMEPPADGLRPIDANNQSPQPSEVRQSGTAEIIADRAQFHRVDARLEKLKLSLHLANKAREVEVDIVDLRDQKTKLLDNSISSLKKQILYKQRQLDDEIARLAKAARLNELKSIPRDRILRRLTDTLDALEALDTSKMTAGQLTKNQEAISNLDDEFEWLQKHGLWKTWDLHGEAHIE